MLNMFYKDYKAIAGVVAGIIIVVGGAWYVFSNSPKENKVGTSVATTTTLTSTPVLQRKNTFLPSSSIGKGSTMPKLVETPTSARIVGVTTISYLFGLKQSLVCSIKTVGTPLERSGTMYIANGEMRAYLTSTSMLDDGTYLYAWTDGASKGLKLLAASYVSGSTIATNGGFDLATTLAFACNSWAENTNVFIPPASVSFSNIP